MTLRFCLGTWWRPAWFSLKGKVGVRCRKGDALLRHPASQLQPASRSVQHSPQTQTNLGAVLAELGERESGTSRLEEAAAAFQAALEKRTRDRVPLQWAQTQMNLNTVLAELGRRESGTRRLEEAVVAYRATLEEWTPQAAQYWHQIAQQNLATALAEIKRRRTETRRNTR